MEKGHKELIIGNNPYETKYHYSTTIKPEINKRFVVSIEGLGSELILNPTIIIELDESSDLEFDTSDIFKCITFMIHGYRIDQLSNNQLKIHQAVEGYNIEKSDSKIFFSIPLGSFNKRDGILESKCTSQKSLFFEFTSNPCITSIKNMCVRTELIYINTKPDYFKINEYYINNSENNYMTENLIKLTNNNDYQILKIKQNQFSGKELLQSNNVNQKIKLYFNHSIDKIFIYFEDSNNSIYKHKAFDKIKFIVDGMIIVEYNYDTLVYDNSENIIGYKLPKGIYQINWDKFMNLNKVDNFIIELCGITIPNNDIGICICANTTNYLIYMKERVELCFAY